MPAEFRLVSFLQPIHAGSPPFVVLLQLFKLTLRRTFRFCICICICTLCRVNALYQRSVWGHSLHMEKWISHVRDAAHQNVGSSSFLSHYVASLSDASECDEIWQM